MPTELNTELENNKEESAEVIPAQPALSLEQENLFNEMIKAGVLYGRKKSKTNPKMGKYIFATRKGIEIFDLAQTLVMLDKAAEFLKIKMGLANLSTNSGNNLLASKILMVGTQPAAKELVKKFAEKFGFSYVIERWLGGTLTNFKVISQRTAYFTRLKTDLAAGRLDKYTKKERLKINEEITKMAKFFSGLEQMKQVPEVVLVIDTEEHQTAVREANRLKIPIIGFANSDSNPDQLQYIVPANDNARSSLIWMFDYLEKKLGETPSEITVQK